MLEGSPTLVIDGRASTRRPPGPSRGSTPSAAHRRNDGDEPAAVLIASAPRTSGYEPMEWA